MKEFLIGRLNASALPHEWFTIGGSFAFITLGLIVVLVLTRLKRWKWLWREWLTSVDPKKIGARVQRQLNGQRVRQYGCGSPDHFAAR